MLLNCDWGFNSSRNPLGKIIPRFGTTGGRVCKRALEGGSGNPSSGPSFAPLTSSVCRCSVPPLCRPEATAVLSASVPQLMLGSPSLHAFAQAVPSAGSGLPLLLCSEQLPITRKHPRLHRWTAQSFPCVSTPWVYKAPITWGCRCRLMRLLSLSKQGASLRTEVGPTMCWPIEQMV